MVAEVWPSLFEIDWSTDPIRDAAQVRATARWLADTDASGCLDGFFAPGLDADLAAAVVAEEGWVLGVRP